MCFKSCRYKIAEKGFEPDHPLSFPWLYFRSDEATLRFTDFGILNIFYIADSEI